MATRKDHRWSFVRDSGPCRRGRACDASVLSRDIPSLRDRHVTQRDFSAPLRDTALVCHDCHLCWHCADDTCSSRKRPGYPEDVLEAAS